VKRENLIIENTFIPSSL